MKKDLEFENLEEFCQFVGLLVDIRFLEKAYGISSDNKIGQFKKSRLPELINLCNKNPELHIVSDVVIKAGHGTTIIMENLASSRAKRYYLAKGSKKPAYLISYNDPVAGEFDIDQDA